MFTTLSAFEGEKGKWIERERTGVGRGLGEKQATHGEIAQHGVNPEHEIMPCHQDGQLSDCFQ